MSDYFVFWDEILKRVRIHKSSCGACKGGKGMHEGRIKKGRGSTYHWYRCKSYKAAQAKVREIDRNGKRKKNDRIDCGLCHPP